MADLRGRTTRQSWRWQIAACGISVCRRLTFGCEHGKTSTATAAETAATTGAEAGADEAAAAAAAQLWLSWVDAGNYAKSWNEAATYFKGAADEGSWERAASGVRRPL